VHIGNAEQLLKLTCFQLQLLLPIFDVELQGFQVCQARVQHYRPAANSVCELQQLVQPLGFLAGVAELLCIVAVRLSFQTVGDSGQPRLDDGSRNGLALQQQAAEVPLSGVSRQAASAGGHAPQDVCRSLKGLASCQQDAQLRFIEGGVVHGTAEAVQEAVVIC
jgi:hypothetical protein